MNKRIEKQIELYKNISEIECIEEILDSLGDLYSEGEEGCKRLPKELSNYSGCISVAYTIALILKEKLKND